MNTYARSRKKMDSAATPKSRIDPRWGQASSVVYCRAEETPMTERRRAPAPRAQAKIKQLETRLAQVEADLASVRTTAARGGLTAVQAAGTRTPLRPPRARAQPR